MNTSGDAAEQIVRMSLEGVEVAAKITGNGAKHLAIALMAILKEEKKTAGKARLTSMMRTGKELNVFSLPEKDLKRFTAEAKKYGVLYCVVKSKHQVGDNVMIDLIVRSEDAPKINRIVENFRLATVDKAKVITEVTKEKTAHSNPSKAKTEKSPPSEPSSTRAEGDTAGTTKVEKKESVRKKLNEYKKADQKQRERAKTKSQPQKGKSSNYQKKQHHQPKRKKKGQSRGR